MNIVELFRALEATSSKNEKTKLLTENVTEDIKKVFVAALDPSILFFVKKPIEYKTYDQGHEEALSLVEAVDSAVSVISGRQITGNAAINWMQETLSGMLPEEAEIFHRVLMKDLRLGLSEVTFNKAMGEEVIREWPCLLASKFKQTNFDKLPWKDGVFVQEKSDGVRANILITSDGQVSVFSRNGKEIDVCGVFDYLAENYSNVVLDGELLVASDDTFSKPLDRKTGNGIINRLIKGNPTSEDTKHLFMKAWDIIPMQDFLAKASNRPYKTRLGALAPIGTRLQMIESIFTHSKEDVLEFYSRMRREGKEGVIIKSVHGMWADKRPNDQIKMKAEIYATLRVVGTFAGQGKYDGMLGGLICQTEDGLLTVNIGSGFDDEQRKSNIDWVGKLIEAKYNELITNKKDAAITMFLPIFVEERTDKTRADTLVELQSRKD